MPIPLHLEEFDIVQPRSRGVGELTDDVLEQERLHAFEKGYQAGWDDAVKAQGADQSRISAAFERTLQDLSFTFHEARTQVLKDLKPLLNEMVGKVVPQLGRDKFGEILCEQVSEIAKSNFGTSIELVIAPASRAAIEPLLRVQESLPVTLIDESSLGEGQAYLRFADTEQHFDLDAVTTELTSAFQDFYALNEKAG